MFVSVIVPMELSSLVSLACETVNLSTKNQTANTTHLKNMAMYSIS